MPENSLSISYNLPEISDQLPALRVTLEPEYVDTHDNLADLSDIDAMLVAAMSGLSARSRQVERCKWLTWTDSGEAVVSLDLYVWPSRAGLEYTLALPAGVTSSPAEVYSRKQERKYWISGSRHVDLPWRLLPASANWHPAIGCLDAWSRQISAPALTPAEAVIDMDGEAYGVLAVSGVAHGYVHHLSIGLQKLVQGDGGGQETNRIQIDKIPVSASWVAENGEPQSVSADVVIPPCVRELLAACGGKPEVFLTAKDKSKLPWTIYYDGCTGEVLARRQDEE